MKRVRNGEGDRKGESQQEREGVETSIYTDLHVKGFYNRSGSLSFEIRNTVQANSDNFVNQVIKAFIKVNSII